ncbi:MAG TPA: DUF5317 domain-containing protein [Actinomycetota bacterium]
MALVAIIVLAALIVGFVARGSLRNFERIQIHWWAVALVGLVLQAIPVPARDGTRWAVGLLLASYVLLIAFVWVNRRLPAAPLILAGLLLNAVVIAANQGMPVSGSAIVTSGGSDVIVASGDAKHHLMTDEDVLTWFADVIPVPPPIRAIVSIGDVLLYSGVAGFVVMVMTGRFEANRRPKARLQRYRGKHLRTERRVHHRGEVPQQDPRTAAMRSGTAP